MCVVSLVVFRWSSQSLVYGADERQDGEKRQQLDQWRRPFQRFSFFLLTS